MRKRKFGDTQREDGHVMTEAEIGIMKLQAKTPGIAGNRQKLGRGKEGIFPKAFGGDPVDTLILDFWPSGT